MKKRRGVNKHKGDQKQIVKENAPSIEIGLSGLKGSGSQGVRAVVAVTMIIAVAAFFGVGPWR